MPRIKVEQKWHGYPISIGSFEISEEGAHVLRGSCEQMSSIDDAVERFMDEIDYWTGKIAEIEEAQRELHKEAMRNPCGMDWDAKFQELHWSWLAKTQVKEALEKDLKATV